MNKLWVVLFLGMFQFGFAQKPMEEFITADYLKTVTLYAYASQDDFSKRFLNPAVANLSNPNQQMILEFDDLRAGFSQYKARIIHCEVDWRQSRLLDMEYLSQINELFINDFKVSQSTKVPYYHYSFVVPKPKISGNYILQLYSDDELVMQQKFWIYETQIDIVASSQPAADPELWRTHQQLNIKLELGNYRIGIPHRELKVMIRMNQNLWKEVNNQHLVNSGRNSFTLQQFSNDYLFPAGNEFRYLDITSSFRKGQNIGKIELGKPDYIYTVPQVMRSNLNFADSYDNDGGFIIGNLDSDNSDITSDYVEVVFSLIPPNTSDDNQTVIYGKLTGWEFEPLEFDPATGLLQQVLLLKNGIYDFAFGLEDKAKNKVELAFYEGDFNQTGNTYEIFVYHSIPGRAYPLLVGYQMTKMYK